MKTEDPEDRSAETKLEKLGIPSEVIEPEQEKLEFCSTIARLLKKIFHSSPCIPKPILLVEAVGDLRAEALTRENCEETQSPKEYQKNVTIYYEYQGEVQFGPFKGWTFKSEETSRRKVLKVPGMPDKLKIKHLNQHLARDLLGEDWKENRPKAASSSSTMKVKDKSGEEYMDKKGICKRKTSEQRKDVSIKEGIMDDEKRRHQQ
ncbi:hypothetical protein BY996DRAFT_6447250 [Phakopsora pachyrhizi]|nr:hypothetical protein BY996DRAFT_6447250 [Phakopsora pachyrhizi]